MAEPRALSPCPPPTQADIAQILAEAQHRWLRPAEICAILQNNRMFTIAPQSPEKPLSGTLFLFDRKETRYFRKDGHNWRKKKDGKTVKEAHEKLKVGSVDMLHCYYAHGEENENFQRRTYWMLDEKLTNIVLVHYLEIKGCKQNVVRAKETEGVSQASNIDSPVYSNSFNSQSPVARRPMEAESPVSGPLSEYEDTEQDYCRPRSGYHSFTEVQQHVDGPVMDASSFCPIPDSSVNQGYQEDVALTGFNLDSSAVALREFTELYEEAGLAKIVTGSGTHLDFPSLEELLEQNSVTHGPSATVSIQTNFQGGYSVPATFTSEIYTNGISIDELCDDNSVWQANGSFVNSNEEVNNSIHIEEKEHHPGLKLEHMKTQADSLKKYDSFTRWMSGEFAIDELPLKSTSDIFWSSVDTVNVVDEGTSANQGELDGFVVSPLISQDQLFSILDISPSWAYAGSVTKVIVTGTFLENNGVENCKWSCMFGGTEVPAEVLSDGSLRCFAPAQNPGVIPFYVTCSNRLACSEVREFEYRKPDAQYMETSSSTILSINKMHLHIRLEKLLSLDLVDLQKSFENAKNENFKVNPLMIDNTSNPSWMADENFSADDTTEDQMFEKSMKEKLQLWLLHKMNQNDKGPNVLCKEGQGAIHLMSALGYDWAIRPIIHAGGNVNFRDAHGWTALHWAAYFGREQTVATLVAMGALPGALTDPSAEYPTPQTPADLAYANGHKGIAGFLGHASLTSQLSALTLKDSKYGRVEEISGLPGVSGTSDSLHAVSNASQALARIHQVYRVQSFHRKKLDEYGDADHGLSDERTLSVVSLKSTKRGQNDLPLHAAAIRIQNKFRGWRGKREFMCIREKIVKIQAHIRGYQVRKNYRKVVWSVGIVEKVILRWRRKRVGLRGFRSDNLLEGTSENHQEDEHDEYDYLKVGRKQAEARMQGQLTRVRSMAQYPEARDQYTRLVDAVAQIRNIEAMQNDGV